MMTMFTIFFALTLCLTAEVFPGIASAAETPAASRSKTAAVHGSTAAQDKEMEAVIRGKLAKSKIGKDGFQVRVQGGVAYWEGTTEVVQHKGSATRMAKAAGATRVVNHIKVSDAAKQQAAGNLQQGRRRAQVKRSESAEGSKRSDPRSQ